MDEKQALRGATPRLRSSEVRASRRSPDHACSSQAKRQPGGVTAKRVPLVQGARDTSRSGMPAFTQTNKRIRRSGVPVQGTRLASANVACENRAFARPAHSVRKRGDLAAAWFA